MLPMPTSTSRQSTIDEAEGSDIDEAESISSYGCCASDGLGCASTAPLCLSSRLLIALAPDRVCWAFPCWTVSHLHPEGALQQHVASQFKQPRLSHDLTVLLCLAGGLLHTLALVPVLWRLRIKLHTYTQDERSKQHVA